MKIRLLGIAAAVLCVAGCAAPAKVRKPRDQMTQREKDSTVAASALPGSGVVKKAISMADAEARQQAAFDSAAKEN